MRLCRNGMVIAQQSDYLCKKEYYFYNPENAMDFSSIGENFLTSSMVSTGKGKNKTIGTNISTRDSMNKFEGENIEITPTMTRKKNNFLTPLNEMKNIAINKYEEKDQRNRCESAIDQFMLTKSMTYEKLGESSYIERPSLNASELKQHQKNSLIESCRDQDFIPKKS